jgi:hypothetical protein
VEDVQAQLLLEEEEGLSLAAAGAPVSNECRCADANDDADEDANFGSFHDDNL